MNLRKDNGSGFIDILVLLMSVVLILGKFGTLQIFNWNWESILLTIVGVMGILFLKAIRMYFIVMRYKMPLIQFGKFYTYTSCVSLVFPYKIGEIFRAYKLVENSNNIAFGILAVIIDRLFDSIPLGVIMIYCYWNTDVEITFLLKIILLFIITMAGTYWIFPSVYKLVNHFLIFKSETMSGLRMLKFLEKIKVLYEECEKIIKDKIGILLVISSLAWILEILIAYMNMFVDEDISLSAVVLNYVDAVVFGNYNMAQLQFTQCAIILLFFGSLYFMFGIVKGRKAA